MVKVSTIPLPVLVKPNGEMQLGLIHAYIVASSRSDTGWIENTNFGSHERHTRRILELIGEIIFGLRDLSSERVGNAAIALEHIISLIPSSRRTSTHNTLHIAAGYLAELTQQCLACLEYGSPFSHTIVSDSNKAWWSQMPSLIGVVRAKKIEIPKKFGNVVPKGLSAIDIWLTNILARLVRLTTQSAKIQRNDTFLEASAYCAALAERYLLRGSASLALLFLHRSADFCLLHVCSKHNNIVDWSFHGGRFDRNVVRGNDTTISLGNSIDVVDSMNLLSPDANRTASFVELNGWRNQLIQTHYLSDIADSEARNMFRKVRPHLENIGGADWKMARDIYLRGIPLSLTDFLDIDGSLTSTFEVVPF